MSICCTVSREQLLAAPLPPLSLSLSQVLSLIAVANNRLKLPDGCLFNGSKNQNFVQLFTARYVPNSPVPAIVGSSLALKVAEILTFSFSLPGPLP